MSNLQSKAAVQCHLFIAMAIAAQCQFGSPVASAQTPAFPSAVGQGAASVGGRGGDVYHVTNLLDYDSDHGEPKIEGSLRHAIRSATGPRTIVFDVGGAIQLHGRLDIRKSKLTIAGQTAPGGITVWGYPVDVANVSDVIIRHLRIRTGDFNAKVPRGSGSSTAASTGRGKADLDPSSANGLDIGRSDRVIVDHVSTAWGMDETLSVTHSKNISVQNCIIAESLNKSFHSKGPHGYGTLIRGELTPADQEAGTGGYTFYGNLWAQHRARNPSIGGQQRLESGQSEDSRRRTDVNLINNVVYGWGDQPTHRSELGEVRINLINNCYINGPAKMSNYVFHEGNAARTLLYQSGNQLDADQDRIHNGKLVGESADLQRSFRLFDEKDSITGPGNGKPYNFYATVGEAALPANETYTYVVLEAGASLARDAIDKRVIDSVVDRTGSLIDSQEFYRDQQGVLAGIDDLPERTRSSEFDTDHDGMPNTFETSHGLNPEDATDRNGTNLSHSGYTNLEVYINGLTADASKR